MSQSRDAADVLAVELRDVDFTYPNGKRALRAVSVAIPNGEVCAVVGPNGCGKTTLFKVILGLVPPERGSARLLACDPEDRDVLGRVGFMAAEMPQSLLLTVREFVSLHETLQPGFDRALAEELLDAFSLGDVGDYMVSELSHGMRKKLQFVAAVSHRPDLLILDEPFSGLDPSAHLILEETLLELNRAGVTVVFAAHDTGIVESLAGLLLVMGGGSVLEVGAPTELLARYAATNVREVYVRASGAVGEVSRRIEIARDAISRPVNPEEPT